MQIFSLLRFSAPLRRRLSAYGGCCRRSFHAFFGVIFPRLQRSGGHHLASFLYFYDTRDRRWKQVTGSEKKREPALCITMKLPAITQFLLTVAAGHYIVKLLGNEPPRHTKHDAAAHFFKKPRRARARRQKIRARSAALFFHDGISDQHCPDIGAGLGDAISPR